MIKKFFAIALAAIMLLLAGCGSGSDKNPSDNSPSGNDSSAARELQLLYCAADTMNPYKTISKLNAELASLLFEPLFKVDDSFEQVAVLAEKITTEGTTHTVTLKNAVFSDGSAVTADDVLFSCELAKECARFAPLFYEIESISVSDGRTIVFITTRHDPYFAKLLTFPILKTDSDKLKDEDNVELVPIGSGRFVFNEKGDGLIQNSAYYGKQAEIESIRLINAPDLESMEHYVEIGATDVYYAEMTDDTIIRMSGTKEKVNLNNLIYLGINHYYGPLKSANLRYAISSALSRKQITEKAFHSNATPANGFFHPDWKATSDYQTIETSANLKISVENLANIGYNKLNAEGFYENSAGKVLELSLLVNGENSVKVAAAELIASQLATTGIKINLNVVDRAEYFRALSAGHFQLYLGEVRLLPNMDISPLVIRGGSAAYGMVSAPVTETDPDEEAEEETEIRPVYNSETAYVSVISGFNSGKNTAADVAASLLSSMPIIPLAYRDSIVFYSTTVESIGQASAGDIFLSMGDFKIKK